MPIPVNESLKLNPDALIVLWVIDLTPIGSSTILRFCNFRNTAGLDVVFQNNIYTAFPIRGEGFGANTRGQLPQPKLVVGNVLGAISSQIIPFDDLVGARVIRKRTFAKYLDGFPMADPTIEFTPQTWKIIQKTSENKLEVVFNLGTSLHPGANTSLPNRTLTKYICTWRYRDADCGYTGSPVATKDDIPTSDPALDDCSLTMNGCELRFGTWSELPIGAFPGLDEI